MTMQETGRTDAPLWPKWTYLQRVFLDFNEPIERELNKMGIDGWEVVNFVLAHDPRRGPNPQYVYLLKRRVA